MLDLSELVAGVQHVVAYVDTIELFLKGVPRKGIRERLSIALSDHFDIALCKAENGYVIGYRVIIQTPSRSTLANLDIFAEEHDGVVCRVDFGYDFGPGLQNWFERHLVMNWRTVGPMHDEENGFYFVELAGRKRRANRNVVPYADRPSKITGELDVTHMDLRFLNTKIVRGQGIDRPRDLIDIDPAQLFAKHLKLVDTDIEQRIIREALQDERRRHLKQKRSSIFVERYRASLPRRLQGQLNRLFRGRVQLLKDYFRPHLLRLQRIPIDVLHLPNELTFPYVMSSLTPLLKKLSCNFNNPIAINAHAHRLHGVGVKCMQKVRSVGVLHGVSP